MPTETTPRYFVDKNMNHSVAQYDVRESYTCEIVKSRFFSEDAANECCRRLNEHDPVERVPTITLAGGGTTLPTINLNGTAPSELLDQWRAVYNAADALRGALALATPHGRDYQVGKGDLLSARAEMLDLLQAAQDTMRWAEDRMTHAAQTHPAAFERWATEKYSRPR